MVRPIAIRKAFTTVVSARKNVVVLKENKPGKTAAIGAGIVGLGATLAAPFTAGASLAALPAAAGTAAAGAGTALASGATGAATGAAGTTAATGLGSKLLQGAKKIGVTDPKKTVGDMAQQASAQHTQNQQQMKQNNLEAAQNVADKAKEAAAVTKSVFVKAGVEVHHQEPLPEEFTQDISLLDRNHQMNPTENGTMINNISPHMLRTIELMAQNYKDDENIEPKPFVMPTLRY